MPTHDETVAEQWRRYTRARDSGHTEYISRAELHDAYYRGDQWDSGDIDALQEQERPALTFNKILPTINYMLSEHMARRADIKFKPRRGADQDLADAMTRVYRQIADDNSMEWVEAQVFSDGLIMDGRGYFDVRIDYTDNWRGEVKITALDPKDVLLDPDAKEDDPGTWGEVFTTRWLTMEELEAMYGRGKANKVAQHGAGSAPLDAEFQESYMFYEDRFGDDDMPYGAAHGQPGEDRRVKAVRVIERQYRKLTRAKRFVSFETGDDEEVPSNWDDEKVEQYAAEHGMAVIERPDRQVRWTVTCGPVLLHDEWSPYGDFTIIPYFAYFRRGEPFGVIRALLSPQDMLNKIRSQELHEVNLTANGGWIFEEDSLVNFQSADDLADEGSKSGLVLEVRQGTALPPAKIPPNPLPQGLELLAQHADMAMKDISGVTDALRGTDTPKGSGVELEARQSRGVMMMQVPMDNLRKTRQRLAERILKLVQRFYTEERIIYIADDNDPMQPEEEMAVNQQQPDGSVINDLTTGEYKVVVGSAPARDSFDEMQLMEAVTLKSAGVMIPDDVMVEYSHLAKKEQLAKRIRIATGVEQTPEQQQIAQMQMQLEMQMAEMAVQRQEAEIVKIEAEAALAVAKAEAEEIKPQVMMQAENAKLSAEHKLAQLRAHLAELTNRQQDRAVRLKVASDVKTTEMDAATKIEVARIQAEAAKAAAAARPKPTGGSK